jgi:hypothetical protein
MLQLFQEKLERMPKTLRKGCRSGLKINTKHFCALRRYVLGLLFIDLFLGKCSADCFWHARSEKSSFGPFKCTSSLKVIKSFCDRWSDITVVGKYINFYDTNSVESVNALEGLVNLKIKHSTTKEGYDLGAYYSSALFNESVKVDELIAKQLGLPWEHQQQLLLELRKTEVTADHERKKSDDDLARRSELVVMRKRDSAAGLKDSAYKSVADVQKHLQQKQATAPKKRKVSSLVQKF